MDLRIGTNYLGYTFEGYPEEPVTETTYNDAIRNGKLTNWRDSNGVIPPPSWVEIDAANTAGLSQIMIDDAANIANMNAVKADKGASGTTPPAVNAKVENLYKILEDLGIIR